MEIIFFLVALGIYGLVMLVAFCAEEEQKKNNKHFRWLWYNGLKESACIVYPAQAKRHL